ncbi:MAG: PPC domain-containing protein [Xenococcaceae cyanobacterium]
MSKFKCFSICLQNLVSIYVFIFAASIITLLTNNVIAGAVEATSIKEQSIEKYQSRELTAQNSELTTNIDYLALKEEILAEINRVRTNPQAYADWLEDRKQYFEGTLLKLPGEKPIITNKGKEALEEAIAWLNNLEPLPKVSSSAKLVNIAQEQIKFVTSTQGSNNLQEQTISYGKYTPEGIVMQLILDDAHPNRINRQKILNPNIQSAGIMCEEHARYENICAIAYEGDSVVTTAENPNIPESISSSVEAENQATPELVAITKEEGLTEKTTPNESENNSLAPLPNVRQRNNPSLLVEKIQQGKLEEGDTVIPNDGSFYDSYPIEGIAGDYFVISVESQDFDTFLAIMDAEGNILGQNDDISETNSNSRLKITLPNNGVYNVIVNAYDRGGKGSYLLTVRR